VGSTLESRCSNTNMLNGRIEFGFRIRYCSTIYKVYKQESPAVNTLLSLQASRDLFVNSAAPIRIVACIKKMCGPDDRHDLRPSATDKQTENGRGYLESTRPSSCRVSRADRRTGSVA